MTAFKKSLLKLMIVICCICMGALLAAAPAQARGDAYTITITPSRHATGAITYQVYKVFDATVADDGTIAYFSSKEWPAKGESGSETIANYFTKDELGNVTAVIDEETGKPNSIGSDSTPESPEMTHAAIRAIRAFIAGDQPVATVTTMQGGAQATDPVTVTLSEPGYYYITTTAGSVVAIDSTSPAAAVQDKNSLPTIEKYERTDQDGTGVDDYHRHSPRSVAVGDTIHFRLEVTIPSTADDTVTITDVMSAGLTPGDPSGVTVKYRHNGSYDGNYLTQGTDYTVQQSTDGDGTPNGYAISIPYGSRSWTGLYIEYTATVNEKAVTSDLSKRNDVTLSYKTHTQTDYAEYRTYAAGVVKFDGATAGVDPSTGELVAKDAASGIRYLAAEFKLQESRDSGTSWADVNVSRDAAGFYYPDAGGSATIKSSETDGQIVLRGLGADNSDVHDQGGEPKSERRQYRLVETKAPDGYNTAPPVALLLTNDAKSSVAITAGDDEGTTYLAAARVAKVANNAGTALPSTGGAGTAALYLLGAGLVGLAGAGLAAKRRRAAERQAAR